MVAILHPVHRRSRHHTQNRSQMHHIHQISRRIFKTGCDWWRILGEISLPARRTRGSLSRGAQPLESTKCLSVEDIYAFTMKNSVRRLRWLEVSSLRGRRIVTLWSRCRKVFEEHLWRQGLPLDEEGWWEHGGWFNDCWWSRGYPILLYPYFRPLLVTILVNSRQKSRDEQTALMRNQTPVKEAKAIGSFHVPNGLIHGSQVSVWHVAVPCGNSYESAAAYCAAQTRRFVLWPWHLRWCRSKLLNIENWRRYDGVPSIEI